MRIMVRASRETITVGDLPAYRNSGGAARGAPSAKHQLPSRPKSASRRPSLGSSTDTRAPCRRFDTAARHLVLQPHVVLRPAGMATTWPRTTPARRRCLCLQEGPQWPVVPVSLAGGDPGERDANGDGPLARARETNLTNDLYQDRAPADLTFMHDSTIFMRPVCCSGRE